MRKIVALLVAVIAAITLACTAATAQAGAPPAFLCKRETLGQIVRDPVDGRYWKCSVKIKFVGPYAYTTYYWLDIGWPA